MPRQKPGFFFWQEEIPIHNDIIDYFAMLDNIIKNHLYNSWLKFKKYLYFTKKGYDMKTNLKVLGKEQNTKIESENVNYQCFLSLTDYELKVII